MADWGKAVEAFQGGADWRQRYRANKQFEKARDLAIEGGTYDMEARRAARKLRDPDTSAVLGQLDPNSVQDWSGGLQDPFATRLMDWFKSRKAKKQKRKQALDMGGEGAFETSNPVGTGDEPAGYNTGEGELGSIGNPMPENMPSEAETFAYPEYADGGRISEEDAIKRAEKWNREGTRNARVEIAKDAVKRTGRKAIDVAKKADDAVGRFTGRAAEGSGALSKAKAGAKRLGAAGALAGTAITTATTDTDQYRKRFGMETDDPSLAGDIAARTLGAASDLGSILTFGAADRLYRDKQEQEAPAPEAFTDAGVEATPQDISSPEPMAYSASASSSRRRSALPTEPEAPMDVADFSDVDIDPREVPDMKTNDWVQYRAQMVDAARRSGNPDAVGKVNDMVTEMQLKGFLNYGQQGFALQQAGNLKGAMAAYRAAFQYFPNGNDVEFGLHKGRDGRQQIVGVGVDEQTGKVVPGTQMVMDPERVTTLLENFKNPAAFRMWTKDWRDNQFRERTYKEVTKPMAQAQADYMATNADANEARAEAAAIRAQMSASGGAGGGGANMRNAEHAFRERMGEMAMQDPEKADYLAAIMSQVKARNPGTPDNQIMYAIIQAEKDGSLGKRLAAMGIGRPQAAAPRQQALPVPQDEGDAGDPEMAGLSPEEIEWANTPAQ